MPIDYTILGQLQHDRVLTPQENTENNLTLRSMTNSAQLQEQQLAIRAADEASAQREEADREYFEQVFQDTNGDFDKAAPLLQARNYGMFNQVRQEEDAAKARAADGLTKHLNQVQTRLTMGADIVGGIDATNVQAWGMAKERLMEVDPELAETMPDIWDEQWVKSVKQIGGEESNRTAMELEGLKNIMSGRAHEGVSSVLSLARNDDEYQEYLQGFKEMKVYDSVLRHYPKQWEEGMGERLALMSVTPLDRMKLEDEDAKRQAGIAEVKARTASVDAQVAQRDRALKEETEARVSGAAGGGAGAVRGSGAQANAYRLAAAAASEQKGGALSATENWDIYQEIMVDEDGDTPGGRKALTSNELSLIEEWRYEEQEKNPPIENDGFSFTDDDEYQTAVDAREEKLKRIEETYQRRLNGGPVPPKKKAPATSWALNEGQLNTVYDHLRDNGHAPTGANVQKFLAMNPGWRKKLNLKD